MSAFQAKLAINEPGDRYEQEADRVSEQVMRAESPDIAHAAPPAIQRLGEGDREDIEAKHVQRLCAECDEEETLQRRRAATEPDSNGNIVAGETQARLDAIGAGQPLTNEQRAYFEPRFGADFSRVRIHADSSANSAARAVRALAYTRGRDIVFREGQYDPASAAGRHLLAHELTHVVQQGAAARQTDSPGALTEERIQRQVSKLPTDPKVYPGQDLKPPGTCSKETYGKVRAGVSVAKRLSSLVGGGCKENPGDCENMFLKIVAGALEIFTRLIEMVVCFKGGNKSHWIEVENKYRMIETCLKAMQDEECDQKLLDEAMEILKQAAKIIAIGAAIVLAVLIVVFWEVIVAAIAAAIAAVGVAALSFAGAAAVMLLLLQLLPKDGPPGGPPGTGGTGGDDIPTRLKT